MNEDDWVCIEAGAPSAVELRRRVRDELPLLRLWSYRVFHSRYRQSALDVAWSVLNPVVILAIYGFVFTTAFDVDGDGLPYLSFAWAGLVVWTFFSSSIQSAAPSITFAADTISKVYFPREVIPLAEVVAGSVDLAIGLALLVAQAQVQGLSISVHVVAIVPVVLVLVAWTAALSVVAATTSVFFRDLRPTIGLIVRAGFIATPIMYPVSLVPDSLQWTMDVNPAAVLMESVRDCVLRGTWPDWTLLGLHAATALVLLVGSIWYTRAVEHRMVDVV
jgi:lipopolysaccharide transport system permease protein